MRILLDTHILQWMILDPDMLSEREGAFLVDPENTLLVSAVTIWEYRLKWESRDRNGVRKGLLDPGRAFDYIKGTSIALAPLTAADCIAPLDPKPVHGDPFDRMLLIHADRLGARLLTRDDKLIGHPLTISA